MRAAIPLHHDTDLRFALAPRVMLSDPALAFGVSAGCTQELPNFLPADADTLLLNEHFDKVGVIEVLVCFLVEGEDFGYASWIQSVTYRPASIPVAEAFKAL